MYGYVTPYKPNMSPPEMAVYRAFYCGICKITGRLFGQLPRFATNYDITFLAALLHDYVSQDVAFERRGCIANPFYKRTTVKENPLLKRIAAANILLAHHKLEDDIIDGGGVSKRIFKKMLDRAKSKADKIILGADALIVKHYNDLRELEKQGCSVLDKVSHPFAALTAELAILIIGGDTPYTEIDNPIVSKSPFPEFEAPLDNFDPFLGTPYTVGNDISFYSLCYNIGKYIYLADALDDIGEDAKRKRYNPVLAAYGQYTKRQQFFKDNLASITFATSTVINRAAECLNRLPLTQSNTLLKNIVHYGLRHKIDSVLSSHSKLKRDRI